MANTTCPSCGEIVRSDLLTCWSCGKKFKLSETFTGVSPSDEPPVERWKSSLSDLSHSEESLREVKREYRKRHRRITLRRFKKNSNSLSPIGQLRYPDSRRKRRWKDLATFLVLVSIIAGGGAIYLSETKQVPFLKSLSYATSEYYRYGFDSVTNINEFTSTANNYVNDTLNNFNQWTDEVEKIESLPKVDTQYSEKECLNLMKLRGMLVALNNATSEELMPAMENSAPNRREFVRGCLDSANS